MKNWLEELPFALVRIGKENKWLKYPIILLLVIMVVADETCYAVKTLAQCQMRRRILASVLACCMIVTLMPATAFAEKPVPGASSLCEHHTEHMPECGYLEAVEGAPCGFVPDAPEEASPSDAVEPKTEPTVHVHDEECGYIETVEGVDCGFVCEICNKEEEEPTAEEPTCVCTEACSGDAVNEDCLICTENRSVCAMAPLPLGAPRTGETTWEIGIVGSETSVTATLSADKTTLSITGTGAMMDWASVNEVPWYDARASITTVTIDNGVTSIGEVAFSGCTSLATVTMNFSDGKVKTIGTSAFVGIESGATINVVAEATNFKTWSSMAISGGTAATFTDAAIATTTLTNLPSNCTITAEYEVSVAEAEWTPTGGEKTSGTFAEALTAMKTNGGSIKLLTAVRTETTNLSAAPIALDLNGQTWTLETYSNIIVTSGCTLTVTDSEATGKIFAPGSAAMYVEGTLLLNGGTVACSSDGNFSAIATSGNGMITIDGGTVQRTNGSDSTIAAVSVSADGTFKLISGAVGSNRPAVNVSDGSEAYLEGGTLTSSVGSAIVCSGSLYLSNAPTLTSNSAKQIGMETGAVLTANNGKADDELAYSTGVISIQVPSRSVAGYVAVSGLKDAEHAKLFTFSAPPTGLALAYDDTTKSIKLDTAKVNAVAPRITRNLSTAQVTYAVGAAAKALDATATVTDSGAITYDWYRNATNSTTGGTKLNVTTATYTPLTTIAGTTYYYCVVTNTNDAATGTTTAKTTSAVANIKVEAPTTVTSVAVTPKTANVQKGNTQQFTAAVTGTNSPAQTVNWNVTGGKAGTSISTSGLLTVAADETAATLTVTAASTVDTSKNDTATVTVTTAPVTKYSLTVTNGTGGSYEAGTSVTVTANAAPSNQHFKEWAATGLTGVTLTDNPLTFTMPMGAVTLTAVYEADPPVVTVDKSALIASVANAKNSMANTVISVQGGADVSTSTYWVLPAIMSAAKSALSEAEAIVVKADETQAEVDNAAVKLNAKVNIDFKNAKKLGTKSGGGSSDSGGSSSGGGTVTTPTPPEKENPSKGESTVTAPVDQNGNASVTVSDQTITDAIAQAKKDAAQGQPISVSIKVETDKAATQITATFPKTVQETLISNKVDSVTIASNTVTMSFSQTAIAQMNGQAKADITIIASKMDTGKLTGDAKTLIGSRPLYDFTVTYGDNKNITSFGSNTVSIAIPYMLGDGETAGNIQAIYVEDNGKATVITNSGYDVNKKAVIFTTSHFSGYGVGYKQTTPVFNDIANHWAKADIEFVASRSLLSGTGDQVFSPNTAMTRGMFVTALGRMAGIDTNGYKTSIFTDVQADAYYTPYVAWAAEKNIVNGATATTFAPNQAITRQEMAVMMQNYAKAMNDTVPKTRELVTFADNGGIGSWEAEAVKSMQMAGVIMGKDGNKFDPTGTATRAEVAAVLHRYVELVIDKATAQGLDVNDSGQIVYYENGRLFTGTKTIDGTTYDFGADGICTKLDAALPDTKKYINHMIVCGDTLWALSRKHKCTVAEIMSLNGIIDPYNMTVGTEIKIPQK